jgi:trans-aconitate 2-methyltransferase
VSDFPTGTVAADLEPYLEAICLGDLVEAMAQDERAAFVHEVAGCMRKPLIDYVRLDIRAPRRVKRAR